jgi:hypothetical protein
MTIDDGNINLEDWIFAMRAIGTNDIVTVKTNGGKFNPGEGALASYELISPDSMQLFADIRDDKVDSFIAAHNDWVSQS